MKLQSLSEGPVGWGTASRLLLAAVVLCPVGPPTEQLIMWSLATLKGIIQENNSQMGVEVFQKPDLKGNMTSTALASVKWLEHWPTHQGLRVHSLP